MQITVHETIDGKPTTRVVDLPLSGEDEKRVREAQAWWQEQEALHENCSPDAPTVAGYKSLSCSRCGACLCIG